MQQLCYRPNYGIQKGCKASKEKWTSAILLQQIDTLPTGDPLVTETANLTMVRRSSNHEPDYAL